jgi:hypothetical protein
VITNDRGEYRLFWLAPDEYLVMAMPIRGAIEDKVIKTNGNGSITSNRLPPAAGEPILAPGADSPLPYFYGGTTDPGTAATLGVKAGDDLGGIDIAIRPVTTYTLRGKVLNLPARTTPRSPFGDEPDFEIRLAPRNEPTMRFRTEMPNGLVTTDGTKGTFEVRGVLPGEYWAYAAVPNSSPGGSPPRTARALVDIAGKDVEDLVITFSQGFDVPIRLVLEGPENEKLFGRLVDSLRLWLGPADGGQNLRVEPEPDRPGTFIVRNVPPGNYDLVWNLVGGFAGAYPKPTRVEGIDRPDDFRLDRTPTRPIEVVFAPATGTVTGNVSVGGATVVAMGANGSYHAKSAADGSFKITDVPPGDYLVYAWESIPMFEWQDPAVLQRAAGKWVRVHLDDGGNVSVNPTLLPAEK